VRLAPNIVYPCALGRSGRRALKREGDGATPVGIWEAREVLYRPDRVGRPRTGLRVRPIRRADGWCDAPHDRNYNRPVRHPYHASAERLWRNDELYDLLIVLGYNDRPRRRGRGSAIFMHVTGDINQPTAGCIALWRPHLIRVVQALGARARVWVKT
jgi:L,D-peptidoglycan transpeptidase YkuD (ErfK/YbiS/YcfS/YnhG family)